MALAETGGLTVNNPFKPGAVVRWKTNPFYYDNPVGIVLGEVPIERSFEPGYDYLGVISVQFPHGVVGQAHWTDFEWENVNETILER
jgi:hypothetical protein